MKLNELTGFLEQWAPPAYQEEYDNSGLLVGHGPEVSSALITLDCTEAVLDEAIQKGCDLVIAHHPIIFKGLKRFTGKNYVERTVMKAIRNGISLYAIHTNLDNVHTGVNSKIGELLGLENLQILSPKKRLLKKLYTFVPKEKAGEVRNALFTTGAGGIGNYIECSFNAEGFGTFRAQEGADPYAGKINEQHHEPEIKMEIIFPAYLESKVIRKLLEIHPYEEPAYDIITLDNAFAAVGSGMTGNLPEPVNTLEYLRRLKTAFNCGTIKYTQPVGESVRKVSFCGGAGFFLLPEAIHSGSDLYITSDIKYHEFFDADGKITLADIGHFESEQFTKQLIAAEIRKKFPNFAVLISETNTNPVNYL
jgi:dinuclear metal center YbgI/SA1388 family protein